MQSFLNELAVVLNRVTKVALWLSGVCLVGMTVVIAYQVFGEGPDLVYIPGWVSNIEIMWDDPVLASILRRLATFCRVILFDKRGTGMSASTYCFTCCHHRQRSCCA